MISIDSQRPISQLTKTGGTGRAQAYGWVLVCSLILLLSAWFMYPIAGGDSIFFMPVAWFYAHGQGLINPLVPLACATDPLHLCRYCFHLPLFPWLIGSLATIYPTVRMLFMLAGLISVGKLWVINRELTAGTGGRYSAWLFGGSMLLATYHSLPTSGRPELLSSLLIMMVFATVRKRIRDGRVGAGWLTPMLLGALLACHFTGFYFTLLITLVQMSLLSTNWKRSLIDSLRMTAVAVSVGVLLVAISPNGFDTVQGIIDHANRQLGGEDTSGLKNLFYWTITNPVYFLIGPLFIATVGIYVRYVYQTIRQKPPGINRSMTMFVAIPCLLAVLGGLYAFVLKKPNRMYDLSQFMGVFIVVLFHGFRTSRPALRLAYSGLLALALIPFVRDTALLADYLTDGKVYTTARAEVRRLESRYGPLAGTQAMWVLFDDLNRFSFWEEKPVRRPVVIEQARRDLPVSVQKNGRLLYDWRTADVRRVMGIPLSNHPQGYSFSVWQIPGRP